MIGPVAAGAPASDEPVGLRESFARVLRYGVVLSAVLLLTGLALAAVHDSAGIAGQVGALPLGRLPAALASGQAWPFLWLGVAVLALTPVVRVALALGAFARARDRDFVRIAGFVLAVLAASLLIGVLAA